MFFTSIIAPDANNILYSIAGAKLDADGNQIPESVVALAPTTSTGASTKAFFSKLGMRKGKSMSGVLAFGIEGDSCSKGDDRTVQKILYREGEQAKMEAREKEQAERRKKKKRRRPADPAPSANPNDDLMEDLPAEWRHLGFSQDNQGNMRWGLYYLTGSHKKAQRQLFATRRNEILNIVNKGHNTERIERVELLKNVCDYYGYTLVEDVKKDATTNIFRSFFKSMRERCIGRRPKAIAQAQQTVFTIIEQYSGELQRATVARELGLQMRGNKWQQWKAAQNRAQKNLSEADLNQWEFYEQAVGRSDKMTTEVYRELLDFVTGPNISAARPTTKRGGDTVIYNLLVTTKEITPMFVDYMNTKRLVQVQEDGLVLPSNNAELTEYDKKLKILPSQVVVMRSSYAVNHQPPSVAEMNNIRRDHNISLTKQRKWFAAHDAIYQLLRPFTLHEKTLIALLPSYIKTMTPETCQCPLHLQFHHFCKTLKEIHEHFHKRKLTGYGANQSVGAPLCTATHCSCAEEGLGEGMHIYLIYYINLFMYDASYECVHIHTYTCIPCHFLICILLMLQQYVCTTYMYT